MIDVWGKGFLASLMPSQDDGSKSGRGGRPGLPSLLPPSQGILQKGHGIRTLGDHEGPAWDRQSAQTEGGCS